MKNINRFYEALKGRIVFKKGLNLNFAKNNKTKTEVSSCDSLCTYSSQNLFMNDVSL